MPGSKELFRKYINPVFIETGSGYGNGIQCAIDAGFKKIYSIEISCALFISCYTRFKENQNVNIKYGDSCDLLPEILKGINKPVTFWLDAHYSGGHTSYGICDAPLMFELTAIRNQKFNTHTIIIDDIRLWQKENYGFDINMIKERLLEINPGYTFHFEDSYIVDDNLTVPNDILVAKI
jgi:hypothetical protein